MMSTSRLKKAKNFTKNLVLGGTALTALITGSIGFSQYRQRYVEEQHVIRRAQEELDELKKDMCDEDGNVKKFVHPYAYTPWYYRLFKIVSRVLYLSYLFVPCTLLGVASFVTRSDTLYDYFVKYLTSSMESAGAVFQKYCQWVSSRPDMFDAKLIEAFKPFCSNAPSHSKRHTRREIKRALGMDIDEVFEEFDEEPIASGTIAQVHRAKLRSEYAFDGITDVIVKVRHPNVIAETYVDADILFAITNFIGRFRKAFLCPFGKGEFLEPIKEQIDLRAEALNILEFRTNFAIDNTTNFPAVSSDLLSENLLIEEFVTGDNVQSLFVDMDLGDGVVITVPNIVRGAEVIEEEIDKLKRSTEDSVIQHVKDTRSDIAVSILRSTLEMFFRDNMIHGDLHGGNVIYNAEDKKITFIDAGITSTLNGEEVVNDFMLLMYGISRADPDIISLSLFRLSDEEDVVVENKDELFEALSRDVRGICGKWVDPNMSNKKGPKTRTGKPVPMGDFMLDIFTALQENDIRLRGDVATTVMSIAMVEGLVRQIDTEVDVLAETIPYLNKYVGPSKLIRLAKRAKNRDDVEEDDSVQVDSSDLYADVDISDIVD